MTRKVLDLPKHNYSGYALGCRCPECSDGMSSYNSKKRDERHNLIAVIKLSSGCMDCGYDDYSCALQFDHREDEEKLFNISNNISGIKWQRILDEIAKCDVVCGNCHSIRTALRAGSRFTRKEDILSLNLLEVD